MVGDGQRLLTKFFDVSDQVFDATDPIKQTVLRVRMQMYKRCHGRLLSYTGHTINVRGTH